VGTRIRAMGWARASARWVGHAHPRDGLGTRIRAMTFPRIAQLRQNLFMSGQIGDRRSLIPQYRADGVMEEESWRSRA
jgi:hypothetical protein